MNKANMVYSILIVTAATLLVSCASAPAASANTAENSAAGTSSAAAETPADTAQAMPAPKQQVNYSSLSPEQEGSELTVTGLFSKGADGSAALIVNPESRSRVTFVLADPEGALATAAPEDGSIVTITGILTDASATWRKQLDVVAVR